jgi:hypothetical protein
MSVGTLRLRWFIGLYVVSVATLALFTLTIKWVLRLLT